MAMTKPMAIRRFVARVGAASVALALLPTMVVESAQKPTAVEAFVTGSANTDGFSIHGRLRVMTDGRTSGQFTILVHRDFIDGTIVAVSCNYRRFDTVVIEGNVASFHSVGRCRALTSDGGQQMFSSDNVFGIVDNGEPGASNDTVDVNLVSGTGVTIPGSALVDGNFVVSP